MISILWMQRRLRVYCNSRWILIDWSIMWISTGCSRKVCMYFNEADSSEMQKNRSRPSAIYTTTATQQQARVIKILAETNATACDAAGSCITSSLAEMLGSMPKLSTAKSRKTVSHFSQATLDLVFQQHIDLKGALAEIIKDCWNLDWNLSAHSGGWTCGYSISFALRARHTLLECGSVQGLVGDCVGKLVTAPEAGISLTFLTLSFLYFWIPSVFALLLCCLGSLSELAISHIYSRI